MAIRKSQNRYSAQLKELAKAERDADRADTMYFYEQMSEEQQKLVERCIAKKRQSVGSPFFI